MPLNSEHEIVVVRFDAFDQAVRRKRVGDESRRELLDPLVMHAVHEEVFFTAQNTAESRVGDDIYGMDQVLSCARASLGEIVVLYRARKFRGHVLIK